MLYSQLKTGLDQFIDFYTQDVAEEPVYFLRHTDPSIIYERASAEVLFAEASKDFMNLHWLQDAHLKLVDNLTIDADLRKLIEQHAGQILLGHTIEDILAVPHYGAEVGADAILDEILQGANINADAIPPNVEQKMHLTLECVYGQALVYFENKVRNMYEKQARCPNTRAILTKADMQSAKPFLNVFLIAARNALETNAAEFVGDNGDKPSTTTLREKLAALSGKEIQEAEELLEEICSGKKSPLLHQKHLQRLQEWGIQAGNPAIYSPKQRAQIRFDRDPFLQDPDLQNRCQALANALLDIENLGIRNPIEKAHFRQLVTDAYEGFSDALALTYFSANHFEHIKALEKRCLAMLNAIQAIHQSIVGKPSDPRVGMPDARERYKKMLEEEQDKLVRSIETAKKLFAQLSFHQETNVALQLREVNTALITVKQQKLEALVAEHYQTLLHAEKACLEKAIQVAEKIFGELSFHKEAHTTVKRQQIQDALAAIPGLGLEETTERHYQALLINARQTLNARFINRAADRFSQLRFNEPDLKPVERALSEIDRLGIEDEVEKAHYQELLLKAKARIESAMQSAQKRFENNRFRELQDIVARCTRVNEVLGETSQVSNAEDIENKHYKNLLMQERRKLEFSIRQAKTLYLSKIANLNLMDRYKAIIDELTRIEQIGVLDEEKIHYRALLVKAKGEFESSKQSAEKRFSDTYEIANIALRYEQMHGTDVSKIKFNDEIEKAHYCSLLVANKTRLAKAIQEAENRFAGHDFDKEPQPSIRRNNIADAIANIAALGIMDEAEATHYHTLLVQEQDALDYLLTRPAAEARFNMLNLFDEEDLESMEIAVEHAIADIGSSAMIPNYFEEKNYRDLLTQTKRLIGYCCDVGQYIADAEMLLGETDCFFSVVRRIRTDLTKGASSMAIKQALAEASIKLEEATLKNYELGLNCTALSHENDKAQAVLNTRPVDVEAQLQSVVLNVQTKLAVLRNDAEAIKHLLLEVRAELEKHIAPSVSPLASQLQGLQQQLMQSENHAAVPERGGNAPVLLVRELQRQTQEALSNSPKVRHQPIV